MPKEVSLRLKTLEREQARLLWAKLDECIPRRFKRKRVRSAGSRSLGAHGRTLLDIVSDAISFAKEIRECPSAAAAQNPCRDVSSSESAAEPKAGLERKGAEGPATEAHPHSTGLMSARGLFCVEVEMQEPLHPLVHREWEKGQGVRADGHRGGKRGDRRHTSRKPNKVMRRV